MWYYVTHGHFEAVVGQDAVQQHVSTGKAFGLTINCWLLHHHSNSRIPQKICLKSFPTETMINHINTLYAFSISCLGNTRTSAVCCFLVTKTIITLLSLHWVNLQNTNILICSRLCLSWPTMCRIKFLRSFLKSNYI